MITARRSLSSAADAHIYQYCLDARRQRTSGSGGESAMLVARMSPKHVDTGHYYRCVIPGQASTYRLAVGARYHDGAIAARHASSRQLTLTLMTLPRYTRYLAALRHYHSMQEVIQ